MADRTVIGKYSSLRVYNNMPEVMSNIQRKLAAATYAGASVLDGYQAAQIPIDTSALANNRTIETKQNGEMKVISVLKFHQEYAAAVNAMVGANWKRPSAVDHWLANAAKENKYSILKVIKEVLRS